MMFDPRDARQEFEKFLSGRNLNERNLNLANGCEAFFLVPGVERQPLKKLKTDEHALLALLERWRGEAMRSGNAITRIVVAYEAGRDGFWLARWLRAQGIEAHVIHAASIAVSREHRRAKTDRLDTELLKRAFLGWLRGERDH